MIYPGKILIELFGRNASPTIVENLGGTIRQSAPSTLLVESFLDFAADPHARATEWKRSSSKRSSSNRSSWKNFNSKDRIAQQQ